MGSLVPVVLEMLGDPQSIEGSGALGVELLRRLPAGVRHEADSALRRALAGDRTLHEVLAAGRLAAWSTSRLVVERIVAATAGEMDRDVRGFTDDTLPALIDEMLYAPVFDVRLYAAMLVHATPYGPAVAAALAAELGKRHVMGDATLACSLLGGIRVLGGAAQRGLVERLIVAPGVAPEIAQAAVSCIGHVGGVSSNRFWLNAIACHADGWRRQRDRHSSAALSGLVYGLGIARDVGLLTHVRDDHDAPRPVRAAAAWWLARAARV